MVTGAVDLEHANAALKVISTPDVLPVLVLGGDHLTDGIEAIQAAVAVPSLHDHFAHVEAKRVGQRFGKRKADLKAAASLLSPDTVMSPAEVQSAARMVMAANTAGPAAKSIVKTLQAKAQALSVNVDVQAIVEELRDSTRE